MIMPFVYIFVIILGYVIFVSIGSSLQKMPIEKLLCQPVPVHNTFNICKVANQKSWILVLKIGLFCRSVA